MQAIARRGDGRVINVSPLWTLQCLSSGPDQMLRQPTLTAKRTMTRAGDVNDGLDRGARPPLRKVFAALNQIACAHMSGLEARCM